MNYIILVTIILTCYNPLAHAQYYPSFIPQAQQTNPTGEMPMNGQQNFNNPMNVNNGVPANEGSIPYPSETIQPIQPLVNPLNNGTW